MDVKSTWIPLHGIEWIMFRGHLDYFQKPPLGGRPNHWETTTLRTFTTVGLFYCIMREDQHEYNSIEIAFD